MLNLITLVICIKRLLRVYCQNVTNFFISCTIENNLISILEKVSKLTAVDIDKLKYTSFLALKECQFIKFMDKSEIKFNFVNICITNFIAKLIL